MKKSKILIYFISVFFLTSCSLRQYMQDIFSEFSNNYADESIDENKIIINLENHIDTKDSINLLDVAFNGNEEIKTTKLIDDYCEEDTKDDNNDRIQLTKNIKNLEINDGNTPSTGNVKGLVLAIDFPDSIAKEDIDNQNQEHHQSVSSYYYNSSLGNLNMQFDICGWITMPHNSSYYSSMTEYNQTIYTGDAPGASAIICDALSQIENKLNLKKYDNDQDGYVDCLYVIYNHKIDYKKGDFWWAYNYFVFQSPKRYDNVLPGNYVFAGYDFLKEDNSICNTITYIHETGHMFGLEDYYDYDTSQGVTRGGLGGADMMDENVGDHNPFSKMLLGWIKNPILANKESEEEFDKEYTIKKYSDSGDIILICDDYDASKGMFQDYFALCYLTGDKYYPNQTVNGIRLYRIHGQLENKTKNNINYEYFKYDNSYTSENLIDAYKKSLSGNYYYSYNEKASPTDLYYKSKSILTNKETNLRYWTSNYNKTTSKYAFEIISNDGNEATIRIYNKNKTS